MKCTIRQARVIGTSDVSDYCDDDGWPCCDTTPDCEEIRFESVNCTTEEFIEWFLMVERSLDRYDLVAMDGEDNALLDIGGSSIDFTVGTVLEVTFDAYFDALLTVRINDAHRELDHQVMLAKRHLGLISSALVKKTGHHEVNAKNFSIPERGVEARPSKMLDSGLVWEPVKEQS